MTTWVLLRGLTREAGHWGGFAARLRHAVDAPVVALDLPGNGTRHREPSPWQVQAMASACRAQLQQAGHAPPYAVVAMSLGAMVALDWAATAPGTLRGCVLINTSVRGFSPFWQRLRPANYTTVLRLMLAGATALEREQAVLAMTSGKPADHAALPSAWAELARLRPVAPANALRQLVAAARYRAPRSAPDVPALVLASAGDRLVSPECSRRLAQAWGWPLAVHPDAGHDLPLDDPHWVVAQIVGWWRAQGSGLPVV